VYIGMLVHCVVNWCEIVCLCRLLRLAASWTRLQQILTDLISSVAAVANAFAVLCVVLYITALAGMQIFGGAFAEEETPRLNYDTLWMAIVSR
jgi:hypothetical protein